ncbi:hypothetical protein D3C87_2125130 [compost metagenome]
MKNRCYPLVHLVQHYFHTAGIDHIIRPPDPMKCVAADFHQIIGLHLLIIGDSPRNKEAAAFVGSKFNAWQEYIGVACLCSV